MRNEYKVPERLQRRTRRAVVAMAALFVTLAARSAPPHTAILSADGTHAVWPKDDGSGFWFSERSRETASGSTATNASGSVDWSAPAQISIRGLAANPVFSPDGRRIAFENPRGGYSTQDPNPWGPTRAYTWGFIAVYDFSDERISYVNPSFAQDSNPRWLDDSTIAYTRRIEGSPAMELTAPAGTAAASMAPAGTARRNGGSSSSNRNYLEALLGAPLVYQPARSNDGESIAFIAREGRTVTVYFARRGEPALALVSYPDDDGQKLSQVAVSNDGRWVAYVRGGPPNDKGEVPNPRSMPVPPQQQIWLVESNILGATVGAAAGRAAAGRAAAGRAAPQCVAVGSEPQFAPDAKSLLWVSTRGIAKVALPAAGSGALEAVQFVLPGPAESLRFSPDGNRIAYARSSHIEIYDFAAKTTWAVAQPAEAIDSDPAWSADGGRVAFRREYGHQPDTETGFAEPFVAKQPWAIWVADPTHHEARQVWRADTGIGSAYYALDQDATDSGSQGDQLLWSNEGHIAFTWEHDGWRHLYEVSAEGGIARLLTPGDGEVESAAVSPDRSQLIYTTNIGDLPRRHIAMVSFAGTIPVQLTGGATSQWAPTPTAAGGVAYIEAGWANPPQVVWQDSARHITAAGPGIPRNFPTSKLVQPTAVSFHGTDGGTAYGQLFVPPAPKGCGVVFVHGGIKRQMLLGFHYMDAYSNLYEMNQYLVSRGCTVLSVEYRSSIMRGYGFRNAPGWGTAGASEYMDVLGGAYYLNSRSDLHLASIGIYGLSWGGYLTAQALARNSDVFKVGFDMAGVHSFPGDAFKYSPVAFAAQWRSPVYVAAGDDDRNVDFNQSILLIQALRGTPQAVDIVEKVFPNETHDLSSTFEHLTDVYWEGGEFMLRHLL